VAKKLISILQLGTIDYAEGLRLQQQLVGLRKEEKIGDVLLLLEHKPVITLGRNAKAVNVIASPELLKKRGVELFETNRGGDVTFHGPGQIVGYPIFDLRGFATDLSSRAEANDPRADRLLKSKDLVFSVAGTSPIARKHLGAVDFVRRLEEVLIRTCADFAIPTKRIPGLTGVWTDPALGTAHVGTGALARPVERSSTAAADGASPAEREQNNHEHDREGHDFGRAQTNDNNELAALAAEESEAKLAAIGIHISRFVTSHGFALNVNTDLSFFNLIVPCGITAKPVTSMRIELGHPVDLNTVAESISRNFGVVFQSQILWLESLDSLLQPRGAGALAR
jgi:lipoyl(octanoyl) transferase